ncbi:MAG TPA: hypothetical protein VGN81_16025 [Pseudonocardiaceae bacterium]
MASLVELGTAIDAQQRSASLATGMIDGRLVVSMAELVVLTWCQAH